MTHSLEEGRSILKFRPCIDLHQGKVKQIVGESLSEANDAIENFVSEHSPAYYANMFRDDQLEGGHVIMLGKGNEEAAIEALREYPGGLQIGGGIHAENAAYYLENGASHVIATSYIFQDGTLHMQNLDRLVSEVGKEKLVIDLSCKEKDGEWLVVTNQWRTFSDVKVNQRSITELEGYCDEFLIHAVDVEGKREGILEKLVAHLASLVLIPTTYAGGVRSMEDLESFYKLTEGKLDITVGSSLDIFGGSLSYEQVIQYCKGLN